ncbi:hypothetical protein MW887_007626 [Aspergillus wentii]|nr:hypothetical protein MW887_007626 [Aspergillus wentii]
MSMVIGLAQRTSRCLDGQSVGFRSHEVQEYIGKVVADQESLNGPNSAWCLLLWLGFNAKKTNGRMIVGLNHWRSHISSLPWLSGRLSVLALIMRDTPQRSMAFSGIHGVVETAGLLYQQHHRQHHNLRHLVPKIPVITRSHGPAGPVVPVVPVVLAVVEIAVEIGAEAAESAAAPLLVDSITLIRRMFNGPVILYIYSSKLAMVQLPLPNPNELTSNPDSISVMGQN